MTDMHGNDPAPADFALELQDAPESGAAVHVRSGDSLGGLGEVWKYGGGTQSVAIAALIVQGKILAPDLAVIADTGRERGTTWQYMDAVVAPALRKVGVEMHRILAAEYAYGDARNLYSGSTLLIPAYTDKTGEVGKMAGYCNGKWKQDVVNHWLRERGLVPNRLRSWIGFSADEMPRVFRMMGGKEYREGRIRFPLVERNMKRRDSIRLAEEMGWPTPPRSACWMCPNQTDAEWRDLRENHPAEFALAVQTEREMRERDANYWLHDSCQPLDTVDFSRPDDLFMRACDSLTGAACFT